MTPGRGFRPWGRGGPSSPSPQGRPASQHHCWSALFSGSAQTSAVGFVGRNLGSLPCFLGRVSAHVGNGAVPQLPLSGSCAERPPVLPAPAVLTPTLSHVRLGLRFVRWGLGGEVTGRARPSGEDVLRAPGPSSRNGITLGGLGLPHRPGSFREFPAHFCSVLLG